MEIIIGLIIIAIGSFGQSSSYVPINKVKDWSWESFWLVQGIFAWLVFPFLGAQLAIPDGSSLSELWSAGGAAGAVIYGVLWGIGGLTFGLSMRYLGVALGQSIALGTCAGSFWRNGFVSWRWTGLADRCMYHACRYRCNRICRKSSIP